MHSRNGALRDWASEAGVPALPFTGLSFFSLRPSPKPWDFSEATAWKPAQTGNIGELAPWEGVSSVTGGCGLWQVA